MLVTEALCYCVSSSQGTLFSCALNLLQFFLPVMAHLCFVGLSSKLGAFWFFLAMCTHSSRIIMKLLTLALSTSEILGFTEICAERFSGIVDNENVEVVQKSRRWKLKQNNNGYPLSILVLTCKGCVFKIMGFFSFLKKYLCTLFKSVNSEVIWPGNLYWKIRNSGVLT